ncbi:MAG TPA: hypothetical protein VN512_05715 [Clostridia bacterium]|nr:hypothetical protein [Clostridia bacterium]
MRKKRFPASIVGGVLVFLLMLAFIVYGISSAAGAAFDAGLKTAEESIRRAAVSCYAIEGVYPPDYAYLKAHYGVRVDETRYKVIYEVFASNRMPDITVLKVMVR